MPAEPPPCPFCGAKLERAGGEVWFHPGTMHDGDCLLSGRGFDASDLALWGKRYQETTDER